MCRKLICLIGLMAVFAWSANALAATTRVDEFDDYNNGQIDAVTGTPPNWKGMPALYANTVIKGAPGNPVNKVLGATEGSQAVNGGAYGILSGNAIIANLETKTLFLRLRTNTSSTAAPNTAFGLIDQAAPLQNCWSQFCVFVRVNLGNLQARDGADPNWSGTKPVDANTWYNVWVVVDHNANTFKVYMNTSGNTATDSDRLTQSVTDPNLGVFRFRTSNTSPLITFICMANTTIVPPPEVFFDDIYVSDGEDLTAKLGKWASNPHPGDGSTYNGTDVTLTWTPGRYADKHDVYFGTDFNDVNDASRANHSQPGLLYYDSNWPNANYGPVTGLTANTKYYWRIDEVSSGGSPIYKGDIWSFTAQPLTAYNPSPLNGAILVVPDANLSWSAGMYAADVNGHKVYFDPCEANVQARYGCEVNDVNRTEPNYDPGTLLPYTTYYWAIDEVNAATPPYTWSGDVWSFTTEPNIPITDPNLVGWWKFDDGEDGAAFDWSGHNRNGTLHGSPAHSPGIFGQAINLDGINDFVSVGIVGIGGRTPRTITGWVKMNTTTIPAWTSVFGFNSGGNYTQFDIAVSGGYGSTAGWYIIHITNWQRNILPPDLAWHHFAATYDGNTICWYGDASLIDSNNISLLVPPIILTTADNVQMGRSPGNANYFPGLIDDVRIYNKVLTQDQIREIMIPPGAWLPYPGYGVTVVPKQLTLTLTWQPGKYADGANGYELYFSSDFNAVNGRTATKHVLTDPCYPLPTPPAPLGLDQTYYWRVDEVNNAGPDPCFWPGDVWKFTTSNYAIVEDFNSYADSDALKVVWKEGSPIAEVSLNTDSNYVREGNSMQYHYDLYDSPYSEADANTAALPSGIGSNWKAGGVKGLTLWFYGQAGNDANKPMYVKLTDGGSPAKTAKVIYDGDMNDITKAEWQEWNIALQDFVDDNDVNLANVKKIAIGFGDGVAEAVEDNGTVYFDDIRLYIPRCMPGTVPDSASGNCLIDYPDLQILTNNWLISDYNVIPVEPNNNNLIGWWKLDEGAGTIAVDSSINDNNGTVYGEPKWVAGHIGSYALDFNGVADYVDCGNNVSLNDPNITGKITLAAWVKTNDCGNYEFNPYIAKGDHAYALQHRSANDLEIAIYGAGTWHFANTPVDSSFNGVWHHLAGTYDGSQLKLYIDGELTDTNDYVGSIPSETNSVDLGTSSDFTDRWYNGLLDDVRIYSRALSQGEVAYLAERSTFTQPLYLLLTPQNPGINLYDDGKINFKDYAVLADEWLEEVLWP